jgi:hypothetical protein
VRLIPPSLLLALLLAPLTLPALAAEPAEPAEPSAEEREAVRQMVEDLREEAAAIRGLAWRYHVPADFLTREQLRANLVQMVEDEMEPEELERDTRIARRVGILGPDEDPLELMLGMLSEMVAGYFNPQTKHLYLIEGMVGDGQKPVILHELVHALEDQYLDLEDRTKRLEDDPDRLFAEQCLVEGSAERARVLYQQKYPEIGKAYLQGQQDPEMMQRQMKVLQKVPAWMMVSTLLHYDLGPKLVGRYVEDDYAGKMAELYAYGPVTQEQLLHPNRYLSERQDYPRRITLAEDLAARAGEDWTELHRISSGELDLAMYLDYFLGTSKGKLNLLLMMQGKYYAPRAAAAAEGWDGGRSVFLEKEGAPIAWIQTYAFDTEADATEALEALRDAYAKHNGGSLDELKEDRTTGDEGLLRTIDYRSRHGRGRLYQDGVLVYGLDGVDDATFERLWPAVLETEFDVDPRDTWDPENVPSALDGLDAVNEEKGVGARLPDGWSTTTPEQPMAALAFAKSGVRGELTAQPSPVGLQMVLPMIEQQLAGSVAGFDAAARVSVEVGPGPGYRYDVATSGRNLRIYLGEAPGKLLVLRFEGEASALAELGDEIDTLVASVVTVEE